MVKKTIINDWRSVKRGVVRQQIAQENKHSSSMQPTDLTKIVINSGVGQAINNPQLLECTQKAMSNLGQGQRSIATKARKSIINFKIRTGMKIGCKVTLRGERMWNFLFEWINVDVPQINNFRGFSKKQFDKRGDYNVGLSELNIFPAVAFKDTFKGQGIQINFVFKSKSWKENCHFLELLGFPFKRD